jgi:hypothetical protein
MENPVGSDVLSEDPENRALYIQHWQSIHTEEAIGNPIQERYKFTPHEITASTFPEMVRYLYRQQSIWQIAIVNCETEFTFKS